MHLIRGTEYLSGFPDFALVGRERDLERIFSILLRKSSNSLLLTGPAGVGISALTLGLQAAKKLPDTPFDIIVKKFFWLDTDSLFACGDSRAINDDFQKMLKKLEQTPGSVLIIKDTFNFMEAAHNTGNSHFINAINSIDKSDNFQVVLEVRDGQLTAVYKWNAAIPELYTLYDVKEPAGEELSRIARSAADELASFHGIAADSSAIDEAIHLTSKYRDSFGLGEAQPQRAISLLDRALASYRQATHKLHPAIAELARRIDDAPDDGERSRLRAEMNRLEQDWKTLKDDIGKTYICQRDGEALRFKLQDELAALAEKEKSDAPPEPGAPRTFAQLAAHGFDSPEAVRLKEAIRKIDREIAANAGRHKELVALANKDLLLTRKEIIAEFSDISAIPAGKLDENERENLINLERNLLSRIFGQDDAVRHVADSIKVARADPLEEPGPAVSYLFMGPSGVGKTEMAKAIAQYAAGDEKALVRFDMSEYMEKHAVAKLIGAPPGYEGFEAGGILTNAVRKKPVGVYLFDEIEKAHPDVFNIFLQILSDGRLTDNIGRTVDFSDIIIIMTSNIGQPHYLDPNLSDEEAKNLAAEELNRAYRSELLNRFNGRENILHFKRLPLEIIERIVRREIDRLNDAYRDRGMEVEMAESCIARFCRDHYDIVRGARGLPGYIKANMRPILVNYALNNPGEKGTFRARYNTERKNFEVTFVKK